MFLYLCGSVSLTEKLDEMLSSPKEPVVVMRPRPADTDSRAATVKQRPTSRRITQAEINVSIHVNVLLKLFLIYYNNIKVIIICSS